MNRKIKLFFKISLLGLAIVYLSFTVAKFILPFPQFHIALEENNSVSIYTYKNHGTKHDCIFDSATLSYHSQVKFRGKNYSIEFFADDSGISRATINGKQSKIIRVSEKASFSPYNNIFIIRDNRLDIKFFLCFFLFAVAFLALALACHFEHRHLKRESSCISFSDTAKEIGTKALFLSYVIAILSCIFKAGVDDIIIISTLNLHQLGIDIYQLESSMDKIKGVQFLMWPYNILMLESYDILFVFNHLFTLFFNPASYNIIHTLYFKLINMTLMNCIVLSVIHFLSGQALIKRENIRKIYYWSVFNPLTFYIAIIYIQLDLITIFFAVSSVLALHKRRFALFGLLSACSISCKSQALILFPIFILTLVTFILSEKKPAAFRDRIKNFIHAAFCFGICITLFFAVFYIKKEAAYNVFTNTPQSERIWWTTVQYAPSLYLLISFSCVTLFYLAEVFRHTMSMSHTYVCIRALYSFSIISLVFSFGIMSTPSTLLYTISGFTLLYAFAKDSYQRFLFAVFGLFTVFEVMFTRIGDITGNLIWLGKSPIFTSLFERIAGTQADVKLISLLFTVSHAAMLGYAFLLFRKSNEFEAQAVSVNKAGGSCS